MPTTFSVQLLPDLVSPDDLAGATAVVIDVLRASTTICHALAAGAEAVIPCRHVEEARQAAEQFPAGGAVLGGERQGLPISGFDLGNSPAEYTPLSVANKTVVFTTTNGTSALQHCRRAARILIGGFVNVSSVVAELRRVPKNAVDVHLVCAGTRGEVSREDVLLAGAITARMLDASESASFAINDQARLAAAAWRDAASSARPLAEELKLTYGGRNLLGIGAADDILSAAEVDRFDFVPEFNAASGLIRVP